VDLLHLRRTEHDGLVLVLLRVRVRVGVHAGGTGRHEVAGERLRVYDMPIARWDRDVLGLRDGDCVLTVRHALAGVHHGGGLARGEGGDRGSLLHRRQTPSPVGRQSDHAIACYPSSI
jgi:hypothetical protein